MAFVQLSTSNIDFRQIAQFFRNVTTAKANPSDENESPAAIQNLNVNGDIYTSNKYAAGNVFDGEIIGGSGEGCAPELGDIDWDTLEKAF